MPSLCQPGLRRRKVGFAQELILSIKGNHKRAVREEIICGGGEVRPGTHGPKVALTPWARAKRDLKVSQAKDPEDPQEDLKDLRVKGLTPMAKQEIRGRAPREIKARPVVKVCVLIVASLDTLPRSVHSPKPKAREVRDSSQGIVIIVESGGTPVSGAHMPGLRVSTELVRYQEKNHRNWPRLGTWQELMGIFVLSAMVWESPRLI